VGGNSFENIDSDGFPDEDLVLIHGDFGPLNANKFDFGFRDARKDFFFAFF